MNPPSAVTSVFGLLRSFAASVIRVAAGDRGPVVPGWLPGPVAAPLEENVAHEDVVRYQLVDEPRSADAD